MIRLEKGLENKKIVNFSLLEYVGILKGKWKKLNKGSINVKSAVFRMMHVILLDEIWGYSRQTRSLTCISSNLTRMCHIFGTYWQKHCRYLDDIYFLSQLVNTINVKLSSLPVYNIFLSKYSMLGETYVSVFDHASRLYPVSCGISFRLVNISHLPVIFIVICGWFFVMYIMVLKCLSLCIAWWSTCTTGGILIIWLRMVLNQKSFI